MTPFSAIVAFTHKGGCPLKLPVAQTGEYPSGLSSIHPQGWVPIETGFLSQHFHRFVGYCSIHPQGWVPIETISRIARKAESAAVAFTHKGGCPLKPQSPNQTAWASVA